MLPIHILRSLLNIATIGLSILDIRVLYFVDTPSDYSWYEGYVYVILVFFGNILTNQFGRIKSYAQVEAIAKNGELVAVTGRTGTGKSSLLLSICGEVEKTKGTGGVHGTITFMEQKPWILNDTIRNNILFGRKYDKEHYNRVIEACALTEDIENWTRGDNTLIGEHGINISGGQRTRLSLARTVYSKANIYVLDDPLSAVDAHVRRHILENVIMNSGLLEGKVRIIAINDEKLLPYFHQVIRLEQGKALVTKQTPREYQIFAISSHKEENIEENNDFDASESQCSTDDIEGASQLSDKEDSDSDSDSDEEFKLNVNSAIDTREWNRWDNIRYALSICGIPALIKLTLSGFVGPVFGFIIGEFKINTLQSNVDNNSTNNSAVLRYLQMNMLERAIDTVFRTVTWFTKSVLKICMLAQNQLYGHIIHSQELVTYTDLAQTMIDNAFSVIELPGRLFSFNDNINAFRHFISMKHDDDDFDKGTAIEQPPASWPSSGKIEFRNFSMKYHEDLEYALKNISLTISPGDKVGIVGRTSAGKTSLTRALFRLVDKKTCEGSILIDGHDIATVSTSNLRPRLGTILQESTVFEGSFKRNLDPLMEHTIEDMWAALITCNMNEFVEPKRDRTKERENIVYSDYEKTTIRNIDIWNREWEESSWMRRIFLWMFIHEPMLSNQLDTDETHGLEKDIDHISHLSDGQKQLFSLCRLLMRKYKIIVLDEATADVDLETDKKMQRLFRSKFKDCTVLTIAHRLETIMKSDKIIVMDKGRVVEFGPPKELIKQGGHFSELVKVNDF
ncbi:ABC transporter C member 13 [Coemansia sp. RSA 1200]|nr:ABC transporter C member 13 [Coemansia sp. RSA 1200]